jgi:hypothetical protein
MVFLKKKKKEKKKEKDRDYSFVSLLPIHHLLYTQFIQAEAHSIEKIL